MEIIRKINKFLTKYGIFNILICSDANTVQKAPKVNVTRGQQKISGGEPYYKQVTYMKFGIKTNADIISYPGGNEVSPLIGSHF